MSFGIRVIPLERYEQFLAEARSAHRTVFHHPLWLKSVEEGLGLRLVILGLHEEDELLGVLPGFMALSGPVRLFGSPLRGSMTPYLGWLRRDGGQFATATTLDNVYSFCTRTLRCKYVEVGFAEPPADLPTARAPSGWNISHRETYFLDLRMGEAALWKNLEQRGRYEVNKARKLGVVVESVKDRSIMDDFYPMLEATFGRHQAVSPHPKRFFLAAHDRLVSNDMMEVLAAKKGDRVLAIGLFVHDTGEVHFLSGASVAEYHHLRPNNLMQWHLISRAAQLGLAKYDLGGKGQPGIDKFKETFGPRAHAYTYYWKTGPLFAVARDLLVRAWPHVQALRHRAREMLKHQ